MDGDFSNICNTQQNGAHALGMDKVCRKEGDYPQRGQSRKAF